MNLYKISTIAEKKNVKMYMPFYVQGKNIQSAYSKAKEYIRDLYFKHKVEIIKIERDI